LIQNQANASNVESEEGRSILMLACEKGYKDIVQKLLESGALVDHRDKKKRTPLFYAIESQTQNVDVVEELISRKADVNAVSRRVEEGGLEKATDRHKLSCGSIKYADATVNYRTWA
jgi:ankyrin repeat protein